MTFSILTYDRETGVFAAAAATGSLCVGGWVLRGDIEAGLVASQGTAPSSFWRDDALRQMYGGASAKAAVISVTEPDEGRGQRQMIALDRTGGTFGFTGAGSVPFADHLAEDGLAIAGNMLVGRRVLQAMREAALGNHDTPVDRMFAVLNAASGAGGDVRGLLSAAVLVLAPDRPPLDLRIDHDAQPITALRQLCTRAHQSPYHDWLDEVPVLRDKTRQPHAN
ncbi:DUF1028 domain-containing protein [Pseudorhodobacter sp.]|uniref:DUF1028 domain-containing protein n=1 Tax=Pseudorhodobacter sp. TaxID=1934400 RepID=UPI0026487D1D|nr:DUF1028 domain-containing protein [Pseudorhodobacter sp.]MDN5787406.1 DUF1028 domain-containing protein [Pseudorhodobacter sp.]